jgi:AcrR family transcriptional regulator
VTSRRDPTQRGRRRAPAESVTEILDAAERLLWERPLSRLSVGELMAHTSLGRSSFYVYFRDINDLAGQLLARLEAQLWEPAAVWTESDADPPHSLAAAVRGVVAVWRRHGPVLRAIVEASLHDDHVHQLWRVGLMGRFIDAVTAGIDRETRAGRTRAVPSRETATALLMLNERYLMDRLGTVPQHDPEEVGNVLATIWTRTLYS